MEYRQFVTVLPPIKTAALPPFHEIGEYDFEELVTAIYHERPGIESSEAHYRRGIADFGVDVLATRADGAIEVASCKRWSRATPAKLRGVSDEFLNHWAVHWSSRNVRQFVLATSAINIPDLPDEISVERARFAALGVKYLVWSPRTLVKLLRPHRVLVSRFLHKWEEELCGSAQVDNTITALKDSVEAFLARLDAPQSQGLLRARAMELLRLNPHSTDQEIEDSLRNALKERDAMRSALEALRSDDNRISSLIRAAESATDEGRFEAASDLLDQAIAIHAERENATRIARSGLIVAKANVALLALDFEAAVNLFDEAAALTPDPKAARKLKRRAAATAAKSGHRFGKESILLDAVNRWRRMITEAAPATRHWASLHNLLGISLRMLGSIQHDGEALTQAVEAFESALTVQTQATMPLRWARTQTNLGGALQILGARQSSDASLERAVTVYRAALTLNTFAIELPRQWATTQIDLGIALTFLGARRRDTATMRQAVAAFEVALTVLTRAADPLPWAAAQASLGIALRNIGEQEDDLDLIIRAVDAYDNAQTVWTRIKFPVDWARNQNNRCNALTLIGERREDLDIVAQAIEGLEEALSIRLHETLPVQYAMTQLNLGAALISKARLTRLTTDSSAAITALETALDGLNHPSLAYHHTTARLRLVDARALLLILQV